jgi:hypothetical protein
MLSDTNLATKRIPVTPTMWATLNKLRQPGQSYTELFEEIFAVLKKDEGSRFKPDLKIISDRMRMEKW